MDTNKETSDRKEQKSNFNLLQTCQTLRNIFFFNFKIHLLYLHFYL